MITLSVLASYVSTLAVNLVIAIVVWMLGKWAISKIMGLIEKTGLFTKTDATVSSFARNMIKTILYVVLIIAIVSILGIPTASVITVLASAGVAVGMALQGSLSNLAGGIMLLIFRPFNVGDYIAAGGVEGTVKEISLVYTVLTTVDNKVITVPNGNLMSANVTNFSAMKTRRVDFVYRVARDADIEAVKSVILATANADSRVEKTPIPFAELSAVTDEAKEFTLRVWVESASYWDVHFQLNTAVTKALTEAGIGAPAIRIINK